MTWNTAHSSAEAENLRLFYSEAQITLGFSHENVLSCLGISTGLFIKKNNRQSHKIQQTINTLKQLPYVFKHI